MKKTLTIILSITLLLMLVGCNSSNVKTVNSEKNPTAQTIEEDNINSQTQTVIVPDVIGMNIDEAKAKLEELGLKVETEIEHLAHKDNNPLNDFEPDLIVLKQDIKQGTVMVKESIIKITYNSNTDGFKYSINDDNTITLTECYTWLPINETITIPRKYEGYKISTIDSSALNIIWTLKEQYKINEIKVPQGVSIIGDTSANIVYY